MDDAVNRLARDLADAIAAAVAADPAVEACREKAKAAGYDLRVSLEAVIGFAPRKADGGAQGQKALARVPAVRRSQEITATDRRFLRSLRIAADELTENNVE